MKYRSIPIHKSRMQERNKALSILYEIGILLDSGSDLQEQLRKVILLVIRHFSVETGRIYILDEKGDYLTLAAAQGLETIGLERIGINEGFTGLAARTRSLIFQHVESLGDIKRKDLLSQRGMSFIVCIPLIIRDKVEGVMNLGTKSIYRPDNNDVDLLTTIGNQIAGAICNARLYEELRQRISVIRERDEMLEFFAHSISHDLKSPATGICGLAGRLLEKYEKVFDEKGKELCKIIMKTSQHMVDLVEEINAFLLTKKMPLKMERIRVKEITANIRQELLAALRKENIRWIETDALPEIVADRLSLKRAFQNLVDNALKYGGEKMSEIKIGYEWSGDQHIFSIKDDGVGIYGEEKQRIFEIFKRNETSKGTTGSGLGLAIVKTIAEAHGGNAWLNTEQESGAEFYISISGRLIPDSCMGSA